MASQTGLQLSPFACDERMLLTALRPDACCDRLLIQMLPSGSASGGLASSSGFAFRMVPRYRNYRWQHRAEGELRPEGEGTRVVVRVSRLRRAAVLWLAILGLVAAGGVAFGMLLPAALWLAAGAPGGIGALIGGALVELLFVAPIILGAAGIFVATRWFDGFARDRLVRLLCEALEAGEVRPPDSSWPLPAPLR